MSKVPSHCCLCGLLCSLEHEVTLGLSVVDVSVCPRRQLWLSRAQPAAQSRIRPWNEDLADLAALFAADRKTLIWIDSADVATLRATVQLAQATGATVHVGGTTGAEITQRVVTSEGWLGSSLAEVATHADLIVTLGDSLLSESPLLSQRFIKPALADGRAHWIHLSSQPHTTSALDATTSALGATTRHYWPRQEWYDRLTELLWSLQPNGRAVSSSPELLQLRSALQQARSSVWLWDVDEFCDAIDELSIRRLLGLARKLSEGGRCSLLCLDANVGRVTAHETLLWLTGCRSTARYVNHCWVCPPAVAEFTLDAWGAAFDAILIVQTIPTVGTLPDLPGSHYLLPAMRQPEGSLNAPRVTPVATVSIDSDGHLFRGDQATLFLCQGDQASDDSSRLPTAAEVLQGVHARLVGEGKCYVN